MPQLINQLEEKTNATVAGLSQQIKGITDEMTRQMDEKIKDIRTHIYSLQVCMNLISNAHLLVGKICQDDRDLKITISCDGTKVMIPIEMLPNHDSALDIISDYRDKKIQQLKKELGE